MELTDAQLKKIGLLSDTVLYPEAVALMREVKNHEKVKKLPRNSQIMGLLASSKSSGYQKVLDYINNQIKRHIDEVFYEQIRQALNKMQQKSIREEFHLVTPQAGRQEEVAEEKELMLLLAREFIQHISAEHGMLQSAEKRTETSPA